MELKIVLFEMFTFFIFYLQETAHNVFLVMEVIINCLLQQK